MSHSPEKGLVTIGAQGLVSASSPPANRRPPYEVILFLGVTPVWGPNPRQRNPLQTEHSCYQKGQSPGQICSNPRKNLNCTEKPKFVVLRGTSFGERTLRLGSMSVAGGGSMAIFESPKQAQRMVKATLKKVWGFDLRKMAPHGTIGGPQFHFSCLAARGNFAGRGNCTKDAMRIYIYITHVPLQSQGDVFREPSATGGVPQFSKANCPNERKTRETQLTS